MCLKDVILIRLNNGLLNTVLAYKKQVLSAIEHHEIIFANSITYSTDDILSVMYDDIVLKYKFHWNKNEDRYHLIRIEPLNGGMMEW